MTDRRVFDMNISSTHRDGIPYTIPGVTRYDTGTVIHRSGQHDWRESGDRAERARPCGMGIRYGSDDKHENALVPHAVRGPSPSVRVTTET